ncbi:MAG TPA: HNH endonuclease family protein [Gemmataceae bacterium]
MFGYDREAVTVALGGPIYDRTFARYVMLRLEYLLQDRTQPFPTFTRLSVEHVLPQNPGPDSQWRNDFTDDQRAYWTHRLANLVLLSRIKNAELSNREFALKKTKYFKSSVNVFPNVVKVMQFSEWTPRILEERQKQLLDLMMHGFK